MSNLPKIPQVVVTEPRLGHSHPAALMDTLGFKVALRLDLHKVVFGSHIFTLRKTDGNITYSQDCLVNIKHKQMGIRFS